MPEQPDWYPNLAGKVDEETARAFRYTLSGLYSLRNGLGKLAERPTPPTDYAAIARELSAGGRAPLNITGLIGIAANIQRAAPVATTIPELSSPNSQQGALVVIGGALYYFDTSTNPGQWLPVSSGPAPPGTNTFSVQNVTLIADTTVNAAVTPTADGQGLVVKVTQDTAGGWKILWGTHFTPGIENEISPYPVHWTIFSFVSIGGVWWPLSASISQPV